MIREKLNQVEASVRGLTGMLAMMLVGGHGLTKARIIKMKEGYRKAADILQEIEDEL